MASFEEVLHNQLEELRAHLLQAHAESSVERFERERTRTWSFQKVNQGISLDALEARVPVEDQSVDLEEMQRMLTSVRPAEEKWASFIRRMQNRSDYFTPSEKILTLHSDWISTAPGKHVGRRGGTVHQSDPAIEGQPLFKGGAEDVSHRLKRGCSKLILRPQSNIRLTMSILGLIAIVWDVVRPSALGCFRGLEQAVQAFDDLPVYFDDFLMQMTYAAAGLHWILEISRGKVFQGVREILLAGDTNRLVAELTFVRINDLAAPPEPLHPLLLLEPFVALLIVANGVMTGVQTELEDWEGWLYFELVFATALLLEILLRISYVGCKAFWCGPDMFWNWFDMSLLLTGMIDLGLQIARDQNTDIFAASLLRLCRLVRLVRIVKIFRLKFMSELRLMVKGLVAGIRTLLLAFSLLFAVIYVISGFTFMMIGNNAVTAEFHLGPFFETLPLTMFTAFRCFIGECIDDLGQPIPSLLARAYGLPFILGYVTSYMLVALGIFNVILAVYVDITMKAAKESEAVTAEQHFHESIRVARTTRELLKKFAAAYRLFHEMEDEHASHLDITSSAVLFTDEEIQDNITITKELFLLVIQDQEVQRLMDDLDMPVDRANMFEIIDADGSGNLQITELVQ
ncbi:rlmN, partial [Symbiodinium sp. CCMP2456]